MKKYKIVHTEKLVGEWYVEAESSEGAIEAFMTQVNNGKIDFSDMELVYSEDNAVEMSEVYL